MSTNDDKKEVAGDEHMGKFVYCSQHMAAHAVGWCTVGVRHKTALTADNYKDAVVECRTRGFDLYGETPNTRLKSSTPAPEKDSK